MIIPIILKKINGTGSNRSRTRTRTSPRNNDKEADKSEDGKDDKKKKEKKDREVTAIEKILIRPLMLLQKVRFNYSEQFGSVVPGFMPTSQLFGQQDFSSPGWSYVLGVSPNEAWFNRAADLANNYQNPWITNNVFLNQQVIQDYQQSLDARISLEPFKDFRIDIEANRKYQENHTEFFKDTLRDNSTVIEHVAQRDIGSVNVSYYALNTLFDDDIIGLFNQFENNRLIISQRLGEGLGVHATDGTGYKEGYGRYQQDVLIPAFLAAYTGKDPQTIDIYEDARKFKNLLPRPNWRLTYNGLAKIKGLDEIFQNVSITHGYKSTFTVNSFNTNFNYFSQNPLGIDNLNKKTSNYYSRFEIPTIVIQEAFSPLLGIDMRMKNGMNLSLDFKKSRNLAFALISNELDESKTTEYVIGFGYRMKDVIIPFLQFGNKKKKKKKKDEGDEQEPPGNFPLPGRGASQANDLNFKFDFSFRDDITIKHILDQNITEPTRGLKSLRISPSVDYAVNNQLTLRLFVDYNRTVPATSASFPITNVAGGLTVRFSLN